MDFLVFHRMYSSFLAIYVVTLLHFLQTTNTLQLHNEDLNSIINYLQKQDEINRQQNRLESQTLLRDDAQDSRVENTIRNENINSDRVENISGGRGALSKLAHFLSPERATRKPKLQEKHVDQFSKVYVVLDPEAKINSADIKQIENIVSSLITSNGKFETKQNLKKQRRYKGFVLMDDFFARRRNRDSNEKFSKDSIERDYKPKRARNGAAGRTAIPYIRHRGDIYEKD